MRMTGSLLLKSFHSMSSARALFVDFALTDVVFSVGVAGSSCPFRRWSELVHRGLVTVWSRGVIDPSERSIGVLPTVGVADLADAHDGRVALFRGDLQLPPDW